jgi:hypothetical protein
MQQQDRGFQLQEVSDMRKCQKGCTYPTYQAQTLSLLQESGTTVRYTAIVYLTFWVNSGSQDGEPGRLPGVSYGAGRVPPTKSKNVCIQAIRDRYGRSQSQSHAPLVLVPLRWISRWRTRALTRSLLWSRTSPTHARAVER